MRKGKLLPGGLELAAKELGITKEDILSKNIDAAQKWDKTFGFFATYRNFLDYQALPTRQADERLSRLLKAIFGNKVSYEDPLIKDVYNRMIEKLKTVEKDYPGTIHPEAEVLDFGFDTKTFFSFPWIGELVGSFYDLVNRCKTLFFKTWITELNEEEIREYDFLANFLWLVDNYVPHTVYYETLRKLVTVYREEGFKGEKDEFFDLIHLGFCQRFDPWSCREFTENFDLAQLYASLDHRAGNKMFKYGREVKYYSCKFRWSDDENANAPRINNEDMDDEEGVDAMTDACCMNDDLNEDWLDADLAGMDSLETIGVGKIATWQHVRVPKTASELKEDARYAEKLIRLGGDPSVGGVRIPDKGYIYSGQEGLDRSLSHGRCYHD